MEEVQSHYFILGDLERSRKKIGEYSSAMTGSTLKLDVPFQSERQAEICRKSLEVDTLLKQKEITIVYDQQGTHLLVNFDCANDRILRTIVNSVIESMKSIIECFEQFD